MAQSSCPPPALTLWEIGINQQCLPPEELLPGVRLCHTPRRQALPYTPILQMRKQIRTGLRICRGGASGAGGWTGDTSQPSASPSIWGQKQPLRWSGRVLSADRPPGSSPRLLQLRRHSHTPAPPSSPELLPAHQHASPCPGVGEWPGALCFPALWHTAGHQDVRGGCHHGPSEASEEGRLPRTPEPSLAALLESCRAGRLGQGVFKGPSVRDRGPRCLSQSCGMAGPAPSCPLF